MNTPFSVLMSVYNKDNADHFRDAVDSVFANSQVPQQFVLVVDGPVGNSLSNILNNLERVKGIDIIKLNKNGGLANALNQGLRAVRNDVVMRADADDINLPYRFERQLDSLQSRQLDLLGSAILEVDLGLRPIAVRSLPLESHEIRKFCTKRNPFNHMTICARTPSIIRAGGYPTIHLKEDYGLWAKMISMNFRVANLPDVLVHARTGEAFYERRGGIKYAVAEYTLQKHLVSCHLKGITSACVDGGLRSAIFLAPAALRKFVYLNLLRKNAKH